MIQNSASLSLLRFCTIVAQMIKSACGMSAKASKKNSKAHLETPDSGVAENSALSVGVLQF
jgi:hypothetical protein